MNNCELFRNFAQVIHIVINNMKKILLSLTMLMLTITVSAQSFNSNSDVNSQWRTKTIHVKGGGKTPDVVTLLKAFHKEMPTWVVGEVMKQYANPAKGTKRTGSTLLLENDEDGADFELLIDPKNGYVGYSSATDVDQMAACVWRRSNGHRIFAIDLYEQHDPVQNLLCWYDYDPQTETMKAELSPIDKYKKPYRETEFSWALPRKGTDFVIREYHNYLIPTVTRIYKWDGMEHKLAKTLIGDFKYGWFGDEDNLLQASKQGFQDFALVQLKKDDGPVLCLRKKNDTGVDYILIVSPFKNNMQAIAAIDEATTIEGFFRVKPEKGAPWKGDEVIVRCRDFESVNYYSVLDYGVVKYIVVDEPERDDSGTIIGHTPHIIGYGSKDESIHIIHADVAERLTFNPQWQPLEFTEETRF